jgi:hypothetical protein
MRTFNEALEAVAKEPKYKFLGETKTLKEFLDQKLVAKHEVKEQGIDKMKVGDSVTLLRHTKASWFKRVS